MSEFRRRHGENELLERILAHLERKGEDERVREMAAEILNGRATLDQVVSSQAYAEAFAPDIDKFADWYHGLDVTDLQQHVDEVRNRIESLEDTGQPNLRQQRT